MSSIRKKSKLAFWTKWIKWGMYVQAMPEKFDDLLFGRFFLDHRVSVAPLIADLNLNKVWVIPLLLRNEFIFHSDVFHNVLGQGFQQSIFVCFLFGYRNHKRPQGRHNNNNDKLLITQTSENIHTYHTKANDLNFNANVKQPLFSEYIRTFIHYLRQSA